MPAELNRTLAARAVNAAAAPLERPTTPSMFALLGVASNWISKAPVCAGMALFCQAPALVKQPGGAGAVTVIAALPLCPSLVAVIVAGPAATPVTSPLPLTVA